MKLDWFSDYMHEYTLKELTSEVIASKLARAKKIKESRTEIGSLEVAPGANQYKIYKND